MYKISKIKLILIVLFIFFQTTTFAQKDTTKSNTTVLNKEENVVFRIQIGASKTKLKAKNIQAIWSGYNPKITPLYEDMEGEWYKYLVGDYENYEEACLAEEEMKVKGSFIVAYIDGWQRVKNIEDVCTPYKHPCYNRNK